MPKKIIVAAGGIAVLVGGAAVVAVVGFGGGRSGGQRVDPARVRSHIAAELPAGWTDTVAVDGGTVTVDLVHRGGVGELVGAIRADKVVKVVNVDSPQMLTLVPAGTEDAVYLFRYRASETGGVQLKAGAGRGHRRDRPDLQFAGRDFMNAAIKAAMADGTTDDGAADGAATAG